MNSISTLICMSSISFNVCANIKEIYKLSILIKLRTNCDRIDEIFANYFIKHDHK